VALTSGVIAAFVAAFCLALIQLLLFWRLRHLLVHRKDDAQLQATLESLRSRSAESEAVVREEFSRNRQEHAASSQSLRTELVSAVVQLGEAVSGKLDSFAQMMHRNDQASLENQARLQTSVDAKLTSLAQLTGQKLDDVMASARGEADKLRKTVEEQLQFLQTENERKLEQMRLTVDEKLQGTLEARLGESFRQVSERLEKVHEGLGAMQTLAAGVGDLKKVLSNVSTRGAWGEVQLGALLEQMLAPEQYERNVSPTGSGERVEYAIRLPGNGPGGQPVWLPIDAKFPIEDYRRLVEASEHVDPAALERARKDLESTIRRCAKTISEKYLHPPATTDFGILFLPTEGLYAEAVRRPELSELIQREFRIVLAGPSTLAALLNSLQMGFRTLAIQHRSSEVWQLLGAVKTEFGRYSDLLDKVNRKLAEAQRNVETAQKQSAKIHQRLGQVECSGSGGELAPPDEDLLAVAASYDSAPA
jgi:DNA recombination protein RmuC